MVLRQGKEGLERIVIKTHDLGQRHHDGSRLVNTFCQLGRAQRSIVMHMLWRLSKRLKAWQHVTIWFKGS